MTEFEIQYTAGELATISILQELIKSVAKLQDESPLRWINKFEVDVILQVAATKLSGGNETANPEITNMAKSIVETVCQMASHKI